MCYSDLTMTWKKVKWWNICFLWKNHLYIWFLPYVILKKNVQFSKIGEMNLHKYNSLDFMLFYH